MARRKDRPFPGTIYKRGNRYWWRVRLPGESGKTSRPLRPPGARFATSDRKVAEALAAEIWKRAAFRAEGGQGLDGSVASLVVAYQQYAERYYRRSDGRVTSEAGNIARATDALAGQFGSAAAEDFTTLDLQTFRAHLVGLKRDDGQALLSRGTVNRYVAIVKRCFKWAASNMHVPASTYHALQTVNGLRRGRSDARETDPVKAVDVVFVNRVLPYCPPTVAAMIQVQLYTGMRSGELVTMRPVDIDTGGKLWAYRPVRHKTSHLAHERVIFFGPKAQKVLRPFLNRRVDAYCFSPAEAMEQHWQDRQAKRTTPAGQGNERGTNCKADPQTRPGEVYDTGSYRKALVYAIRRARADGQQVPDFTPHRLRHTAATLLRKELGLDAARVVLGHRSLSMASDYAELDGQLARQAMAKLG